MHVATKRLYGHAHFSYSCMHVATKRLYGPAIFSRQDAIVIHASVQTSLFREPRTCRHRPSAIIHQKLLFLFTCFILFFLLVSCMCCVLLYLVFYSFHACVVCLYLFSSTMDFPAIDGGVAEDASDATFTCYVPSCWSSSVSADSLYIVSCGKLGS